jgi:hypothetical protein
MRPLLLLRTSLQHQNQQLMARSLLRQQHHHQQQRHRVLAGVLGAASCGCVGRLLLPQQQLAHPQRLDLQQGPLTALGTWCWACLGLCH